MIDNEVKKIDGLFPGVQTKNDVLLHVMRTLIEDIWSFNVEYKEELEKKK